MHYRKAIRAAAMSEWRLVEPILRESLRAPGDKDLAANYAAAIEAYAEHGRLESAVRLYREARGREDLLLTPSFFSRTICCLTRAGELGIAMQVYRQEILGRGLQGGKDVFDELLGATITAERYGEAREVVAAMRREGISPTRKTFNQLLSGYAKTKRTPETLALLRELIALPVTRRSRRDEEDGEGDR